MANKVKRQNLQEEEIPLLSADEREEERLRAQYINGQISRAVGVKDSVVLGSIFSTFMTEASHKFLEEIGKYFLFPLSALAHAIQIVLAWRDVKLSNKEQQGGAIGRAVVETVTGLSVVGIVIGALAFSAVFGALTPVLFAGTILAKTLFKAGSAVYYGIKGAREEDPNLKAAYYEAAAGNAVATGAGILSTFAVTLVMKLGYTIFAPLGIAAGIIGGTYAIITGVQKWREQSKRHAEEEQSTLENSEEAILTEENIIRPDFVINPAPQQTNENNNNNNNRPHQEVVLPARTRTQPQPIFTGQDTVTLFANTKPSDSKKDLSKSMDSHLDKKVDMDARTHISEIRRFG